MVAVCGVEREGEEVHRQRRRDHPTMKMLERPKCQATESAETYVGGVLAETWWKSVVTCGKVSADR